MRALFLVLLLANLVFFALQFEVVRAGFLPAAPARERPLNAERLRVVRDTSSRTGAAPVQATPATP